MLPAPKSSDDIIPSKLLQSCCSVQWCIDLWLMSSYILFNRLSMGYAHTTAVYCVHPPSSFPGNIWHGLSDWIVMFTGPNYLLLTSAVLLWLSITVLAVIMKRMFLLSITPTCLVVWYLWKPRGALFLDLFRSCTFRQSPIVVDCRRSSPTVAESRR